MSTHFILVDDSNAGIKYRGGPWFLGQNKDPDTGYYGPVWNNTVHGVTSNASLSFTFNGSSVSLYGTIAEDNLNNVIPTWDCFIDGVGISNSDLNGGNAPDPRNNWELCATNVTLPEGSHTVTLQTTVVADSQTFWFDYIKYAPSLDARLDNEAIYIDDTNAEIRYDGTWETSGPGQITNQTGSSLNFSFIGISITWYAMVIPHAMRHALSTYSIDGQNPTLFEPLGGTNFAYNQVLFQATSLPMGLHSLQVVYNGTEEDTPLNIDFLVVQNGSIPTASTASSTTPTTVEFPSLSPSINSTSAPTSKAHKAVLEATCATLGALIIFGGLGILFLRRRKRFRLTPFPIAPVSLAASSNLNHDSLADISLPPIQLQNHKSKLNGVLIPPHDRTSEAAEPRRTARIPDAELSRELPPTYTLF